MRAFVFSVLLLTMIFVLSNAQNVEITDTAFMHALIDEGVDTNGDSLISYAEAEAIVSLDLSDRQISDMTGIEAFGNLDTLRCGKNKFDSLDVSQNNSLRVLLCGDGNLTNLDVSNNTDLRALLCDDNQLTSLDVLNNVELRELSCRNNQLTSLDISANTFLSTFIFNDNQLTEIDLSNNALLRYFDCIRNKLTKLNVSNCTSLVNLRCSRNSLVNLDISNNSSIVWLTIESMPSLYEVCVWANFPEGVNLATGASPNVYFTTDCIYNNDSVVFIPDTAFLHALIDEGVDTNGDSLISYTEAETVISLDVDNRGISNMSGIKAFINLDTLQCSFNQLTSLDVSNNTVLKILSCFLNRLTTLDVSNCNALIALYCRNNKLSRLDVSGCISLRELYCGDNQLFTLDISDCNALQVLDICDMLPLYQVCVWTIPFPPHYIDIQKWGSPNVYFTDCKAPELSVVGYLPNSIEVTCTEDGWIYLVPEGTNKELMKIKEKCIGDSVKAFADSTVEVPIPDALGNEVYWLYARDYAGNISEPDSITILGVWITNAISDQFKIYPNPANLSLNIKTNIIGLYTIEITSLNGQLLYKDKIEGPTHQIDLSSFEKGLYFITIRSRDYVRTEKIIKQ